MKVWKKIIGASYRHSGLEVHSYVGVPHNGNLLDSLFPNALVKGFRIISMKTTPQIDTLFKILNPLGYTISIVPLNSKE